MFPWVLLCGCKITPKKPKHQEGTLSREKILTGDDRWGFPEDIRTFVSAGRVLISVLVVVTNKVHFNPGPGHVHRRATDGSVVEEEEGPTKHTLGYPSGAFRTSNLPFDWSILSRSPSNALVEQARRATLSYLQYPVPS